MCRATPVVSVTRQCVMCSLVSDVCRDTPVVSVTRRCVTLLVSDVCRDTPVVSDASV